MRWRWMWRTSTKNLWNMLRSSQDRSSTYGSNSWMTLSNLKTEKSLVENAEGKAHNGSMNCGCFWCYGGNAVRKWKTHRGQQPWTGWAASAACPVSHRTNAGSPAWSFWRDQGQLTVLPNGRKTALKHGCAQDDCGQMCCIVWSKF